MVSFKKICCLMLSILMMLCTIGTTVFAADVDTSKITSGTFKEDVSDYLADGYVALKNLDNEYVVGKKPTATVNDLGALTINDYTVYGGSLSGDLDLNFVMQFLADQTAEDMTSSPYADWYGDFVLTFDGLSSDSFTADGCYLAGYYGTFGWVVIPVDGMLIENGVRYPVMLGVGMGQKYDYICESVKDFRCALYLTDEILDANPNINVSLELSIVDNSKGEAAAATALADKTLEYVNVVAETKYSSSDFKGEEEKVDTIFTNAARYYDYELLPAYSENVALCRLGIYAAADSTDYDEYGFEVMVDGKNPVKIPATKHTSSKEQKLNIIVGTDGTKHSYTASMFKLDGAGDFNCIFGQTIAFPQTLADNKPISYRPYVKSGDTYKWGSEFIIEDIYNPNN